MVRVPAPALSQAKLRVYAAPRAAGITKSELARRLKSSRSQVDRLLDITHHSKLDQIKAAFAAIGKRLAIEVLDAALEHVQMGRFGSKPSESTPHECIIRS